jgi:hypothetical protein
MIQTPMIQVGASKVLVRLLMILLTVWIMAKENPEGLAVLVVWGHSMIVEIWWVVLTIPMGLITKN